MHHQSISSIAGAAANPQGTIAEVLEYEGRAHLMPSQTGWEEIADHALSWATEQAAVWAARRPLAGRA